MYERTLIRQLDVFAWFHVDFWKFSGLRDVNPRLKKELLPTD